MHSAPLTNEINNFISKIMKRQKWHRIKSPGISVNHLEKLCSSNGGFNNWEIIRWTGSSLAHFLYIYRERERGGGGGRAHHEGMDDGRTRHVVEVSSCNDLQRQASKLECLEGKQKMTINSKSSMIAFELSWLVNSQIQWSNHEP